MLPGFLPHANPRHVAPPVFRESLRGLGSAWIAASWTEILGVHEHARRAAANPPAKLEFFTPEQAAEIDARAAQIIPAGETPGAREGGVRYFICSLMREEA
jgi:hypothetical protein